jgi:phosphoglycolate phosphatase
VNATLRAHGLAACSVEEVTLLIGSGAHALMHQLLARQRSPFEESAVLTTLEQQLAAGAGTISRPYAGAHEALALLRANGIATACVTNKEQRMAERVLQAHGLLGALGLLIGGNTLPHKKPHASVLQHVARHFGVPLAAVAHVGDSATDVQAARNAGVAAWAVPWGYNGGQPIEAAVPDLLFTSLLDVARHAVALAGQTPR